MVNQRKISSVQSGFSLVELMVGLVIGLLATLVIMQVFSAFEGQKRTTSGTADAQTNGSIALATIQRHVQKAGYGLPLPNADIQSNALRCNPFLDFDPDSDPLTNNNTNLFPLIIQNGVGGNGSDDITVRFSTTAMGAVPVQIINASNPDSIGMLVQSNIGCNIDGNTNNDDVALIQNGLTCDMATVDRVSGTGNNQRIILAKLPTTSGVLADQAKIACMGDWRDYRFQVVNEELQLNQQPIVSDVISMQAQYGVSATAGSNDVTAWVDAAGIWNNPTVVDRNRIKAIRMAVVLRNGLKEKTKVTTAAPIAWSDSSPIAIDVSSSSTDWEYYRYRVFGTVVPLRNMIWSRGAVE
jgi:type IV pilus assembly protein PilW